MFYLLVSGLVNSSSDDRGQYAALITAVFVPLVVNLLFVLRLTKRSRTSLGFAGGALSGWALFRKRLLRSNPVA